MESCLGPRKGEALVCSLSLQPTSNGRRFEHFFQVKNYDESEQTRHVAEHSLF